MKLTICLLTLAIIASSCHRAAPQGIADQENSTLTSSSEGVWIYELDGDRFSIVVLQNEGMSEADARKAAHQKAAEQTVQEGYRYYVVETEGSVQVLESNSDYPQNPPPNLYNERILNKDEGRSGVIASPSDGEGPRPGYRVTLRMYQEKPAGKWVDACKTVKCGR